MAVVASVLLVVGVAGLATAAWVVKRLQTRSANRVLQQAAEAAQAERYDQAFTLLAAACDAQPDVPELAKRAALAALAAGRVPEASSYARRAWDAGVRDEDVLGALLAGESSAGNDIARAEALISALPDQAARLRLRARLLVAHGRMDDGVQALRELVTLQPSAGAIAALAELLMQQGGRDEAFALLNQHRVAGRLDADGYRLLARAQAEIDLIRPDVVKRGGPLAIIAEARERNLIDDRLRFDEACYRVLRLDLRGAIDVLHEITASGLLLDAQLLEVAVRATVGTAGEWRPPGRDRLAGAAGEALGFVSQALSGSSSSDAVFTLQKAERLIGEHPALHLLIARLQAATGEREAALGRYRQIRGYLSYAPMVLLEQAEIHALLGHRDAAVGLVLAVHRLHGPTRRSLILFDALAGGMVGPEVVDAMRRLAASQTGDRQLALLSDDLARRQLASTSPAEQALNAGERAVADSIRGRLVRREFTQAFEEAEASTLPVPVRQALRGFALQGLGRHAEAIAAFTAARVAEQPAYLHLSEALSALAIREFPAAIAAVGRARTTLPGDGLAWQIWMSALIQDGHPREALEQLETAAATGLDPLQIDALRGFALAAAGRPEEALKLLMGVLHSQPAHPTALPLALDLHLSAGHPDAVLALLQSIDIGRDPALLLRRLAAHLARADHRAALADLDLVPEHMRSAMDGESLRIRLLCMTGDVREAQRWLGQLPAAYPPTRRAVLSALVQERSGRRSAAIYMLRDHLQDEEAALLWTRLTLADDPQASVVEALSSVALDASAMRRLAALLAGYERWSEALALVSRARALAPQDPLVLNDWAWYSAKAGGSVAEAVGVAQESLRLLPGNPVVLETVALLMLQSGKGAEALGVLQGQTRIVEETPQLLLARARAHAAAGDGSSARRDYDALLSRMSEGGRWLLREPREAVIAEAAAFRP